VTAAHWDIVWHDVDGDVQMGTEVSLKGLTLHEGSLVKDGLACLLAALPSRHTDREAVQNLIDALKDK
jgi:hypothetical protein